MNASQSDAENDPVPTNTPLDRGLTIWLTGLPCAGKTTIARALSERLIGEGRCVEMLDGDEIRSHLGRDLGFSRPDRDENVRRVGYVANLLSRNGVIVVCSLISPYQGLRAEIRAMHQDRFFEVYVATPLEVCAARDVKGLYAKQRAGKLTGLSGVDDPYEAPTDPEVVVPAHLYSVEECVGRIWDLLHPS